MTGSRANARSDRAALTRLRLHATHGLTVWTPEPEPTKPQLDPDETGPLPVQPAPRRRIEVPPGRKVDRSAPDLARLCAGWAHRGRAVEDLVGLVHDCWCHPTVMPRDELSSRLDAGTMLDAMRAIRTQPGRLAVVEISFGEGREEEHEYREHHILVPQVDAADTRGRLGELSAERGDLLRRRIEELHPRLRTQLAKDLFDYHTPDALYLEADYLERGGALYLSRRRDALPDDKELLDAAEYETHPGKMLCIVRQEWNWQPVSAAWIDLDQLGLFLEADPCFEWQRMHDVIRASCPSS